MRLFSLYDEDHLLSCPQCDISYIPEIRTFLFLLYQSKVPLLAVHKY